MKTKLKKRLTLLLAVVMIVSLFAGLAINTAAADDTTYLAFSSDFHYDVSYTQNNLDVWLTNLKSTVSGIDYMSFCGDMGSAYAKNAEEYWTDVQAAMDTVDKYTASGFIKNGGVYTYGNHEWFTSAGGDIANNKDNPAAKKYIGVGEAAKTDKYIIYCFGAMSQSQEYLDADIATLEAYLKTAPTSIPIFILTHFPISSYTSRVTKKAAEVVEILNNYPNVVYLFGHNHTVGDTHYDTFYKAGDTLEVAKGDEVTINFTYAAGGCMSDLEYHSGNGSVKGKGLLVGINGSKVNFAYYGLDGKALDAALTVDMNALTKVNNDGPFTVTFKDGLDGAVIDTQTVAKGADAKEPSIPTHEGYNFVGWDKEFKGITRNITVTAAYKAELGEKKLIDNLYVEFADFKGPIFTFTNVLNQYYSDPDFQYGAITYLFFGDNATLSWNKNVKIYLAGAEAPQFTAGKTYKIDELNGYYFYNSDSSQFYFICKINDATYDANGAASNNVNGLLTAYAVSAPVPPKVVATKQAITLDGKAVNTEVYNIDGSNYFKLRDIAYMLNGTGSQFSVGYDEATKTIQTKTGEAYTAQGTEMAVGTDNSKTAVISSQSVTVNGKAAALSAFNIGGYNFFKLVDLGAALKFDVAYDEATKTVAITSRAAEEKKPAADKGEAVGKVYFYAVIDIDIATDKDGKQIVYYPVPIYKDDTVEDAITTLNETAIGDGSAWEYDEDNTYGYYLTKLLGKDVGTLSYGGGGIWTDFSAGKHVDIKSAVTDGMIIYLNLHTGALYMRTGYFDKQYAELKAGDSLTLTYNRCSGDGSVKPCSDDEVKVNGVSMGKTDSGAKISLTFDEAGEYIVTGIGKNSYGTGVCYVVVK